jgi:hypothetical protein
LKRITRCALSPEQLLDFIELSHKVDSRLVVGTFGAALLVCGSAAYLAAGRLLASNTAASVPSGLSEPPALQSDGGQGGGDDCATLPTAEEDDDGDERPIEVAPPLMYALTTFALVCLVNERVALSFGILGFGLLSLSLTPNVELLLLFAVLSRKFLCDGDEPTDDG